MNLPAGYDAAQRAYDAQTPDDDEPQSHRYNKHCHCEACMEAGEDAAESRRDAYWADEAND